MYPLVISHRRLSLGTLFTGLAAIALGGWLVTSDAVSPGAASRPGQMPVTVAPFEGPGGIEATAKLRQVIGRTTPFQIGQTPAGNPVVAGKIGSGFIEGRLMAGNGRALFEKRYQQGSLDLDLRQFADDVALTLTKRPGIATSQIAFTFIEAGRPHQIYLCDFDGGNVRRVPLQGMQVAPALSPDGTSLAHATLRPDGLAAVHLTELATAQSRAVPGAIGKRMELAISPDGESLAMSFSPDGGPNSDLYLATLPRGKASAVTRTPVPESSPSWSPDGRSLVFAAAPAPGRSDLFIYDLRKKSTTPLPTGQAVAIDPAWSPDGSQIAFVAVENGGRHTVCVRDIASGHTRRLTSGSQPVWGADSRHLLYVEGNGLSMLRVDSGARYPVILGGGRALDPAWTR